MKVGNRACGEVSLLIVFLGFILWYFHDSYTASSNASNLLLVAPVSALAFVIASVLLVSRVLALWRGAGHRISDPDDVGGGFRQQYGVVASMFLLALYVVLMPWIGFDLATFLFISASMVVFGERRLPTIGLYSVAISLVVTSAMKHFLFVPFPTLLPL